MADFKKDLSVGRNQEARARGYNPETALQHFVNNIQPLSELLDPEKPGPAYVSEAAAQAVLEAWRRVKNEFFALNAGPEVGRELVTAIRALHAGIEFPEIPQTRKVMNAVWVEQTRLAHVLLRGIVKIFQSLKSSLPAPTVLVLEECDTLAVRDMSLDNLQRNLRDVWGAVVRKLVHELGTYRPVRKRPTREDFSTCTHPMAAGAAGNDR